MIEPRRSFTVQAAMQEVAQPDALAQPAYADNDQGQQDQFAMLSLHTSQASSKLTACCVATFDLTVSALQPAQQQAR